MPPNPTRREFLATSAAVAAPAFAPRLWFSPRAARAGGQPEPLVTAVIGAGRRGTMLGEEFRRRTVMAAVCDVDRKHAEQFRDGSSLEVCGDYRKLLDRKDIEAVVIATPDHWHTPICLRALRSGKDVYCEKPLTLTIDEGKLLVNAVRETGRVVQVGTQRRTDPNFLNAVILVRSGRFGAIRRVVVFVGMGPSGGPFRTRAPPAHLDWDFWLGQAPAVPYTRERCHGSFRWWYEYSGGSITDWGSHHVDIAQWAIGMEAGGPVSIEPGHAELPDPGRANSFNTAKSFSVRCGFPGGVSILIDYTRNFIQFDGTNGSLMLTRSHLVRPRGKYLDPLELSQADRDWLAEERLKLFQGREPKDHIGNFLDAVKDRRQPMSDVFTHHRALTTCHLANIAIRTGRKITWDPERELAVGDDDINRNWLGREQRKGWEVV